MSYGCKVSSFFSNNHVDDALLVHKKNAKNGLQKECAFKQCF